MSSIRRFVLVPAVILATAFVMQGCSGEVTVGEKTVSASELETQAADALASKIGEEPASIECPEDLKAEVGETEVCALEDQQGGSYDMTITITEVKDDGKVDFDIQVGDLKQLGATP